MSPLILIADDNSMHRQILKKFIESEGYNIIETENGEDAIEYYKKNDFDIVMLDVMMPNKSGFDVIREMRNFKKDFPPPIILITAKSAEEDIVEGLKAGADEYITKPFKSQELKARISAMLRFNEIRKKLLEEKIKASKQETLLQLVITLSHYINNSATSILGRCQLVDIEDVESIKKLIQVTQGETEKIVAVVKSLKEMADKAEIKTIPYQGADGEMIDIDEILKKFI